jgi:hypothetical protein
MPGVNTWMTRYLDFLHLPRRVPLITLLLVINGLIPTLSAQAPATRFNPESDLLLLQYDCKTDVDDLHSVAAAAMLLRDVRFADVRFHAVAGAYGIQDGEYVPANELFAAAFGDDWSDAHNDPATARATVAGLVVQTLDTGGDVWVAEAGQSDFTADWLHDVLRAFDPSITRQRVHVVQHSEWNESVTAPDKLDFVRKNSEYVKIPDGNATANGSPGLRLESDTLWPDVLRAPESGPVWRLARETADRFNGQRGRYFNEAIGAGGMDFSDTAEVCWILGLEDLPDADAFVAEFLPADR